MDTLTPIDATQNPVVENAGKPKKKIVTKTAIFKLHNPSRRKRLILDTALRTYTDGYRELLELARDHLDELIAGCSYQDKRGKTRLSDRTLAGELGALKCTNFSAMSGVLRESICKDVAGNLLSYLALKPMDDKTQYPQGRTAHPQDEYLRMLDQLVTGETVIETKEEYDYWRDNLSRMANYRPQPIYFCRVRDFNLAKIEEDGWGVDLKLMPRDSRFGVTRLRFPLAFGEWHEKTFLEQGKPRAAHLVKRGDNYFLPVAFEFEVEIRPTETFLGIDRGVLKQLAFAVTDCEGKVLTFSSGGREVRAMQVERGKAVQEAQKKGRAISRRRYKQKAIDERIHVLANQIVVEAQKYKSQVVMEDLNVKTAGKFTRSNFAKLEFFLSYKLPLAGLPAPREVFAAYSSQICFKCGSIGTRDEDNREVFRCSVCGSVIDADENAAVNIARRVLYRKAEWETRGGYREFHNSFAIHSV